MSNTTIKKRYSVVELRDKYNKAFHVGITCYSPAALLRYGATKYSLPIEDITATIHYYTDNILDVNCAKWFFYKRAFGILPTTPYGKGMRKQHIEQYLSKHPFSVPSLNIKVTTKRMQRLYSLFTDKEITRRRNNRKSLDKKMQAIRHPYNTDSLESILKSHKAYKKFLTLLEQDVQNSSGFRTLILKEILLAAQREFTRRSNYIHMLKAGLSESEDKIAEINYQIRLIKQKEKEIEERKKKLPEAEHRLAKEEISLKFLRLHKKQALESFNSLPLEDRNALEDLRQDAKGLISLLHNKSVRSTYSVELNKCKTVQDYKTVIALVKALLN